MTPLEQWAAWPLLAMFCAAMWRGWIWATQPRRTLLDEHYEELEK